MAIKINGTNTTASPGITGPDTDTGLVYGTDEVQVVTGGTTRATVDSSGKLGVGTSSPSFKITLQDGTILVRSEVTTGSGNQHHIGFSAKSTGGVAATISSARENVNEASALTFNTWDGSSFAERGRFSASGNFGIGSTAPNGKLAISNTLNSAYTTTSRNFTFLQVHNPSSTSGCYAGIEIAAQGVGNLIQNYGNQYTDITGALTPEVQEAIQKDIIRESKDYNTGGDGSSTTGRSDPYGGGAGGFHSGY